MYTKHSRRVAGLETTAKSAFAAFDSSIILLTPPPAPDNPREAAAHALMLAVTRPDEAFKEASFKLNASIGSVENGWQELARDIDAWGDVVKALRGEQVTIADPTMASAVNAVVGLSDGTAAALAREIEVPLERLKGEVGASSNRHVTALRNAARIAVHGKGERLYMALGRDRDAKAHRLRLDRARIEHRLRSDNVGVGKRKLFKKETDNG